VSQKQRQPTTTDQYRSWSITIPSTAINHGHITSSLIDKLQTDSYESTRIQATFHGFEDVAITYVDTHHNLIGIAFGSLGSDKSFSGTYEFSPETRLKACITQYRFDDVILTLAPDTDSNEGVTALQEHQLSGYTPYVTDTVIFKRDTSSIGIYWFTAM